MNFTTSPWIEAAKRKNRVGGFRTPPARSKLKIIQVPPPFANIKGFAVGRRALKLDMFSNRRSTQQDIRHDDAQGKYGDQGDPYEGFHLLAHSYSFRSQECNGPITSIQAVILWF
jgi:hypothetical protein